MPNRRSHVDAPPPNMPPADTSVLRERVYNVERQLVSTQGELHEIRSTMATAGDVRGLESSIASLAAKLESMGRPQWQAYGVMLTAVLAIGALAYWPIREQTTDIKATLTDVVKALVPRVEHEREWRRAEISLGRLEARTEENQRNLVHRDTHNQTITNLQRQIDEQRQAFGSTYSLRDAFAAMQRKVDDLEGELRQVRQQSPR